MTASGAHRRGRIDTRVGGHDGGGRDAGGRRRRRMKQREEVDQSELRRGAAEHRTGQPGSSRRRQEGAGARGPGGGRVAEVGQEGDVGGGPPRPAAPPRVSTRVGIALERGAEGGGELAEREAGVRLIAFLLRPLPGRRPG